jgi:hypothetical protein
MSEVFTGFSTNKTDRHDITEILLKVALNTKNHKTIKEITWHRSLLYSQEKFEDTKGVSRNHKSKNRQL